MQYKLEKYQKAGQNDFDFRFKNSPLKTVLSTDY